MANTFKNPEYNHKGGIDCILVTGSGKGEKEYPYTVEVGSKLEQDIKDGKYGQIAPCPPERIKAYEKFQVELELENLDRFVPRFAEQGALAGDDEFLKEKAQQKIELRDKLKAYL